MKEKFTVIGIDVGGSTTKIVGFRQNQNGAVDLIPPQFVRAADQVTSIYGAFGKFTLENHLSLEDIDRVMTTGVGSRFLKEPIYALDCRPVSEFSSIGIGGLFLSGLREAIVVSMGTGTALIHAKKVGEKTETTYLGGTGVGGGTLIGLSKKLTGISNIDHLEALCAEGDLANVDLRIKDLSGEKMFPEMNDELTASNFGNVSDVASSADVALGLANMVAETIAMISIFAAKSFGIRDIVLTGNLTKIAAIRHVFEGLEPSFGVKFLIPENAQFGTVIGAALNGLHNDKN